ncbi:MAG: hypothetical protein EBQ92_09125 [Proteobacteria bacterium]|nr:hypothetical protein [Pseudomonadota bacterium]
MRILGLDFGTWSIKAVEMESRWRRIEILDFHEVKMPLQLQEPMPMYQAALQQLLASLPSHPDKIVTSLSSDKTGLRFLRIPITSKKKVEQMYQFELEDGIPFKLEDSIVEHRISPDGKGSLVFAAVAPKRFVKSQLEWYQSVGADPDWLCFDGMGAINLFLANPPDKNATGTTGANILCDIGHTKTTLAVLEGGNLTLFRTFGWGSFKITELLAETWAQALEDAEETKHKKVDLLADDFGGIGSETTEGITQILRQLVTDISHTVAAYRSANKKDIATLYITGGGSELRGLDSFLTQATGLNTVRFSPFAQNPVKEELKQRNAYRFTESWGRAQVFARKSPFLFNFRKKELAKHTSLDDVGNVFKNPHLVKLLQFSAVFAVILFVHVTFSSILASQQQKVAADGLSKVFQDTFRSVPQKVREGLINKPEDLRKFVDQKVRELDQKIQLASKSHVAMGTLFKKVSAAFPPTVKVDVRVLEIDDKRLLMKGTLYQGDLNQVIEALKASQLFADLTQKDEAGKFEISGRVVGR